MKKVLPATVIFALLLSGCITFQFAPPNNSQTMGATPVILIFSSNPPSISAGGTSTLLWNVTGATSVSIDQGIGQVAIAGSRVVSPVSTTVYTITATGTGGTATSSAIITVIPASSSPPQSAQPASPAFAVIRVTANTQPSARTGCYTLYADVTTNGPGNVSYVWESLEGGGYSYTWTIQFAQAGTQRVTLPPEMSMLPSGKYRLRVTGPNVILSNPVYYTTCQ